MEISVVTDPVLTGREVILERTRAGLRNIRNRIISRPSYLVSPYRGHASVTRSLVEGAAKAGLCVRYNPRSLEGVSDVVVVLSGIPALKQMIRLKRKGFIKHLIAGPNLVVYPTDNGGIIASPEIDLCITPSEGICSLYVQKNHRLAGRCVPWAAGVDEEYWSPSAGDRRDRILIYAKRNKGPIIDIEVFKRYLLAKGYKVVVIEYGKYSASEFRNELRRAKLMVGFSRHESQGIAWAEAWSVNVPTILWESRFARYRGERMYGEVAPYLTEDTGVHFRDLSDFSIKIEKWEAGQGFRPREWVLENMTDVVCARRLFEIASKLGSN